MDGRHTPVSFFFLILTISGGFRLVLTETKSLQRNYTHSVGRNVVIACSPESMNSTNQPSWFKYDQGKIVIYDASSSSNSNSSKYSIETGNKTLTVMNAQWNDAVTYCCNVGGLGDYCSNVVLIGSNEASVMQSYLVRVGDNVTLTCTLKYNAPSSDPGAPFPLSDDQDPKLSMSIGPMGSSDDIGKVFKEPVVDVSTVPHMKTISINKTVEVADLDQYLRCSGPSSGTLVRIAPIGYILNYPNNESSLRSMYSINEAFKCFSERFPFLNVTWTDVTTPRTPRIISTGIGNATAKILAPGKYVWTCSVTSPLENHKISTDLSFTASAGEKVTRSILLTAGYMLFIAFIIF